VHAVECACVYVALFNRLVRLFIEINPIYVLSLGKWVEVFGTGEAIQLTTKRKKFSKGTCIEIL